MVGLVGQIRESYIPGWFSRSNRVKLSAWLF